jgi:hypothetical protein
LSANALELAHTSGPMKNAFLMPVALIAAMVALVLCSSAR